MIPRIVVVGSVHMDLVATAERLPERGETMLGSGFAMHPGGKGANQAIQCALLGHPTLLVGRVGNDGFGRRLTNALRAKGVNTDHVGVDRDAPTGVSTVLVGAGGDYASIVVTGASQEIGGAVVETVRASMSSAGVVLLQLEIAVEATVAAARLARSLGASVVLNAAPMPSGARRLPANLACWVDVVVVNEGEARSLAGTDLESDASGTELAGTLRTGLGVPAVASDASGERWQPGYQVEVADTIGAGDAFVGCLASRLAIGIGLDRAMVEANAAGALAVTRAGAYDALPTETDIRRFIGERPPQPESDLHPDRAV